MIDDEKIIELFFERSEQGIRELDMKYGKICHNLSYNIVNSRRDAEECVNDAYLGAWNAIPPVHPNPLLSYIVKIVRNISLKTYWRKEAAKRSGHYTVALEEIEGCIADQKTVEDEIEAKELARIFGYIDRKRACYLHAPLCVCRHLRGHSKARRYIRKKCIRPAHSNPPEDEAIFD